MFNLLWLIFSFGQTKPIISTEKKNQFRISFGLGYEDGLIFLEKNAIPTFGMGYERRLNKHFSLAAHNLLYYRAFSDFDVAGRAIDFPSIDKFRGSSSPFLTQLEKDKLDKSGIFPLNPKQTLKFFSLSSDLGLTFYPLSTRHHRIGINAAYSLTYESHNWWKDMSSGILTLEDGSQKQITLAIPVEYRNLSSGIGVKLTYDYSFKDYLVGFRWGNYNVFFPDLFDLNEVVWDTSIYFGFKF